MGNGPKDVQWVPGEPSRKGHSKGRKKLAALGLPLMAGAWRPIYRASPESQCTMLQCRPGADASGKVEA